MPPSTSGTPLPTSLSSVRTAFILLSFDEGLTTPAAEFADVLEQFESQFYQQALKKFQASDFTSAGFVDAQVPVQQFTQIQLDEATHQTALEVCLFTFCIKALNLT